MASHHRWPGPPDRCLDGRPVDRAAPERACGREPLSSNGTEPSSVHRCRGLRCSRS